eukprot:10539871-Karenia_brevis.AAC.1
MYINKLPINRTSGRYVRREQGGKPIMAIWACEKSAQRGFLRRSHEQGAGGKRRSSGGRRQEGGGGRRRRR